MMTDINSVIIGFWLCWLFASDEDNNHSGKDDHTYG